MTRPKLILLVALSTCSLRPGPAAADSFQASASPAAVLAVRRVGFTGSYTAVFSLTSPLGAHRSASVKAQADEPATITFGDRPASVWGMDDGKFNPTLPGTWTWLCNVDGKTVAHGAFVLKRTGGRISIETTPPSFK